MCVYGFEEQVLTQNREIIWGEVKRIKIKYKGIKICEKK